MNIGIYFNKNYIKDNQPNIDKITSAFGGEGFNIRTVDGIGELDGIDILFVLGGDGTILTVASECAVRGIKIIGINYGHMGFLSEFEPEKIDGAIQLVRSGKFRTVRRSILKVEFCDKTFYALNDVVIQRSTNGNQYCNTINLRAEIDGSTVDNYSSDGIIVSTPTGSTAYSLSAGGSILTPDIAAFIMTPICAHSLHSRPIVFSDSATLSVTGINSNAEINVIVDGRAVATLSGLDKIKISKAEKFVEFIVSEDGDFFNKLFIKLNIWSR